MSFCYEYLDELIREFLVFRGFASTLKAFDNELKNEKERSFRPDRVMDQIGTLIGSHDLGGLRDLWRHLENRLFARLDPVQSVAVTKFESGLMKLYLVNCIQNKRPDKVKEFFERMTPELHLQNEFRDWFALPFVVSPESHPTFSAYFGRQWQDTLMLSLQNFLSLVFASAPAPRLADFSKTNEKLQRLREENSLLRKKVFELVKKGQPSSGGGGATSPSPSAATGRGGGVVGGGASKLNLPEIRPPDDVMDDFFIIAQEVQSGSGPPSGDAQVRGLKSFLRNFSTGLPSPSAMMTSSKASPKPPHTSRTSPRSSTTTQPGSTGVSSTSSKPHAPLTRVSQSSLNPLALKPATSTFKEIEATFILLSQEEYNEHRSEITHCRFSKATGNLIASSDVDGVVKVWSVAPSGRTSTNLPPTTLATFVSSSPVTALDWLSKVSDRFLVVGNASGSVKICDQLERKTCHELNVGTGVVMVEAGGANGTVVAVSTSPEEATPGVGGFAVYDLRGSGSNSSAILEFSFSPPVVGSTAGGGSDASSGPVITCCKFNHNSQMVTTGATDGKIRIFDLRRRDCISSWTAASSSSSSSDGSSSAPASSSAVTTLHPSHDDTSVYTMTEDGVVSHWSLVQTGQKLSESHPIPSEYFSNKSAHPRSSLSSPVFAFTSGSDERHFLISSTDGGDIYGLREGNTQLEKVLGLRGHSSHVTCVDWSTFTDHGPSVTGGFDGKIVLSTLLTSQ